MSLGKKNSSILDQRSELYDEAEEALLKKFLEHENLLESVVGDDDDDEVREDRANLSVLSRDLKY